MIHLALDDCFATLHDATGDIGVVMCPAQGFEELCARKEWRVLAEQISQLGLPALRFDFPGAADALGGEHDPGRMAAWTEALDKAIAWMRREAGVKRIVLAGLRLGGALAAMAAGRDDVAGLILINPVVSGKAYVRELGMMAKVMSQAPGAAAADGIEVAGFAVSSQTLAAMAQINLQHLQRVPPHVLVCAPDGSAGASGFAARCANQGSDAVLCDFPHYQDWLGDPTLSRAPAEAFECVTSWLAATIVPQAGLRAASLAAVPVARLFGEGFVEEAICFGPGGRLSGILCQPEHPMPHAATVVLTNAGRNYHIGWARGWVEMARILAGHGIASLRMDAGGIGDSADVAGRDPQVMYTHEPQADVSAALDMLEQRGFGRFCVAGLCSGAHLAFHSAVADSRIAQLVLVNLQKFVWKQGDSLGIAMREAFQSTDHYKQRLFKADTWKRILHGEVKLAGIGKAVAKRFGAKAIASVAGLLRPGRGDGAVVRASFRQLAARGTQVLLIYSLGDGGIDELALHFGTGGRGLARYPGTGVAYIADADHNLTSRIARERFIGLVAGFAGGHRPCPRQVAQATGSVLPAAGRAAAARA